MSIASILELTRKPNPNKLADVHKEGDGRGVSIDQVGITNVRYPIVVLQPGGAKQHTVAQLSMSVNVPHDMKGTHMSRFVEVLNEYSGEMSTSSLPVVLRFLRERLESDSAHIEMTFPYFLSRPAPVSGAEGLLDYECSFIGEVNDEGEDLILKVRVPVASLCPCSKKISDYGAHNQRSYVTIEVRATQTAFGIPGDIPIDDLIEVAERSGSAPVYPLLKRPDERYITMQAYDNPRFVEDIIREAVVQLEEDPRVAWFKSHVENCESIHSHDVFATIEHTR